MCIRFTVILKQSLLMQVIQTNKQFDFAVKHTRFNTDEMGYKTQFIDEHTCFLKNPHHESIR